MGVVIEAVVMRRLKWLVAVVEFVVKSSGIGCCGDFFRRRCENYGEGCSIVGSVVRV